MLLKKTRLGFPVDCRLYVVRLRVSKCIGFLVLFAESFTAFPSPVIVVSAAIVAAHARRRPCGVNIARTRRSSVRNWGLFRIKVGCLCSAIVSATTSVSRISEMTMVMDASSVGTMAEPGADALGFVFDASSGLYYDASSGFYYDAKAGWYYNTQNGQYYVYENDSYVPLAATTSDEALHGAGGDEESQSLDQSASRSPNHEDNIRAEATIVQESLSPSGPSTVLTQIASPSADQEAVILETPSQIAEDCSATGVALVESESEWQDATCGHVQSVAENPRETPSGLLPGTEMSSLSTETVPSNNPEETLEATGQGESVGEPEESRPASVWIAETLTELYSHYAYMRDPGEETWQEAQYHDRRQWGDAVVWDDHATMDDESDDESEELEEGEWRPDEDERGNYVFADIDEVEEGEILEDPSEEPGISGAHGVGNGSFNGEYSTNGEDYLNAVGEFVGTDHLHTTQANVAMTGNEIDLSTSDVAAEEQWQAQYLPTAKLKARSHIGSMDLWDWSIVEQEKKVGKKEVKKMFRLIGRLAPNATQVHPSLRASGGRIRTTPIREIDHEFVKVSSGRIYKLRRPSSKHLAAYPVYASSNPTQDWGFPLINSDSEEDDSDTGPAVSSSADPGHFYKQRATKKKHSRLKLTGVDGEPQPKYRDRAAERRILHRGFGIGPGQKIVSFQELEKLEADAATELPGALEKAASARRIGRDNIGKRMLEGMGWKEGQSLGPGEGGLVDPILAMGNTGRTGLGWG